MNDVSIDWRWLATFLTGLIVWMVKLSYTQGKIDARVQALWEIHMEGSKQTLKKRGRVNRNSPWAIADIRDRLKMKGGPANEMRPLFESMLKAGLPKSDIDLALVVKKKVGMEKIAERAVELELTAFDYITFWIISLREAEQHGSQALYEKLGI